MLVIMLPRKDDRRWWRKLLVNIAVVVVLGTIALTLPQLIGDDRPVSGTQHTPPVLICERVVLPADTMTDYPYVWQIYLQQNKQVVTTWGEIYQAYQDNAAVLTFSPELRVTKDGFVYIGTASVAMFTGWVCYQGQWVTVSL